MALACTYLPPTCAMTSAYSFSAPTAMIAPFAPGWSAADEDEQPAASRAAPARAAHARMALGSAARLFQRFGMAGFSQVCEGQRSFGLALPVMIMILTLDCNAVGRVAWFACHPVCHDSAELDAGPEARGAVRRGCRGCGGGAGAAGGGGCRGGGSPHSA